MKKILSIIITFLLLLNISFFTLAVNNSRAVIGADLTDEQINIVYNIFGISRGLVPELRLTNSEERKYLEGFVDDSIIGSYSISCVYIEMDSNNTGVSVSVNNCSWVTPQMYKNAVITAGIDNASIHVAAPFQVSGTAALAGIYKAYEDITGETISEVAKLAGTHELTVTAELANQIGDYDSLEIVEGLKEILSETIKMSDDEVLEQIDLIASEYGVSLNDSQKEQLLGLCRSLEKLDDNQLLSKIDDAKTTIKRIGEAKDRIETTAKSVGSFVSTFIDNVDKLVNFVKGIFTK